MRATLIVARILAMVGSIARNEKGLREVSLSLAARDAKRGGPGWGLTSARRSSGRPGRGTRICPTLPR